MSKVALQIVLGAVALVALVTGAMGLVSGIDDPFFGMDGVAGTNGLVQLDSLYRYYDGLWLGMGLVLVPVTWRVERHPALLRAIALMVFVGAVGRVVSMIQLGLPHPGFVAATVAELLFPLLIPWQRAVARRGEGRSASDARPASSQPTPGAVV